MSIHTRARARAHSDLRTLLRACKKDVINVNFVVVSLIASDLCLKSVQRHTVIAKP